ncbi:MAG: response regulator transcription factor [Treponemataceae bacterium]|nr:response regulator transcription factor [Treponemataceae bacterium]
MTIAIADDEQNIRTPLKAALQKEQFTVLEFENGLEAWNGVTSLNTADFPDLFILDIMMPEMDGLTLFRKIKGLSPKTPVMFLTSRDDEFDKVLGLELGADDYLTKPYSIRELIARIHVILRRYGKAEQETVGRMVRCGDILLDTAAYTATRGGEELALTVTEFRLLEAFISNPKTVFTREQLIQKAYPDDVYMNDRAVDCHIKRLRKKVGAELIETVYGLGYRLSESV